MSSTLQATTPQLLGSGPSETTAEPAPDRPRPAPVLATLTSFGHDNTRLPHTKLKQAS